MLLLIACQPEDALGRDSSTVGDSDGRPDSAETGDTGDTGEPGPSEADSVVVVYNPAAEGSLDVAEAYAAFRGVSRLCAVESTTADTLAGADYPAFVDAVFACTDESTVYLVPVYGVPYKVSDRIADISGNGVATVSLDALLFFGPGSVDRVSAD
ncbi:MAG: hypothetical protein FJ102_10290, partial [Deltaproteobacteria bacterium]|nr:hypothetical protein [Deltaproteobacteria bacterium]